MKLDDNRFNALTAETTGIVATCGGETVCLIDCGTGQVMKRYKHAKEVKRIHFK